MKKHNCSKIPYLRFFLQTTSVILLLGLIYISCQPQTKTYNKIGKIDRKYLLNKFKHPEVVLDVSFSENGQQLGSVGFHRKKTETRIWNLTKNKLSFSQAEHTKILPSTMRIVNPIVFSEQGNLIATGDAMGQIILRNVDNGKILQRWGNINMENRVVIRNLKFQNSGRELLTIQSDWNKPCCDIKIFDTFSGKKKFINTDLKEYPIELISISENSPVIAAYPVYQKKDPIYIFKLEPEGEIKEINTIETSGSEANNLLLSRNGEHLSTITEKGIKIWRTTSGRLINSIEEEAHFLNFFTTKNEIGIISATNPAIDLKGNRKDRSNKSSEKEAKITCWDITTGEPLAEFTVDFSIIVLKFSSDYEKLALAGTGGNILVLDFKRLMKNSR